MNKHLPYLALLLVLGLGASALYWDYVIKSNLPPHEDFDNQALAWAAAVEYKQAHGGQIIRILGTGSMAPLIPPSAPGRKPEETIVAFVITEDGATYEDIVIGDLVSYKAAWSPKYGILHVALMQDSGGWIMSGLHNSYSEPQWRVTRDSFLGITAKVFNWPQT